MTDTPYAGRSQDERVAARQGKPVAAQEQPGGAMARTGRGSRRNWRTMTPPTGCSMLPAAILAARQR